MPAVMHEQANGRRTHDASRGEVLWRAVENRASLALLELQESHHRFRLATALAVALVALLMLAGMAGTAAFAAAVWDTDHRLAALTFLFLLECGAAVGIAFWIRGLWQRWRPFESTREQLAKDYACLQNLIHHPNDS